MAEIRMVESVTDDGGVLRCLDGSEWAVNPGDMPTVILWLPTDEILIEDTDVPDAFNWKASHLGSGAVAWLMPNAASQGVREETEE